MNRRSFFRQSVKGLAGIVLAPIAAKLLPAEEPASVNRMSVKFIRTYEHGMDILPSIRLDVVSGFVILDPNHAALISGGLNA